MPVAAEYRPRTRPLNSSRPTANPSRNVPRSRDSRLRRGSRGRAAGCRRPFLGSSRRSAQRALTTLEEQQELEQLAVKLRDALGARVGEVSSSNKALAIRERIFTRFYREYAQLRRVVEYLRFDEGDADEVLPSIFVRSGRKNKGDEVIEPIEDKPVEDKPASPVIGGVPQDDPFVR